MEGTIRTPVVEVDIQSFAAGGDGIGRDADGRVVFVPRTAPGDKVRARIVRETRKWARGVPAGIVSAGRNRRAPACPLYSKCGGCHFQHVERSAELEAKRRTVRDVLRRIGKIEVRVPPLNYAERPFGYRNRITPHLRRFRDGRTVAGFYRFDRPGELVEMDDCLLAEPAVRNGWRALREAWEGGGLLPGGESLRLTLRASVGGDLCLLVAGGTPGRPGDPEALAGCLKRLTSYMWIDDSGRSHVLAGSPLFRDSWLGFDFELGPDAFLQVNREVAALIDHYLGQTTGDPVGVKILDLYAGVGARALRLGSAGATVVAVESNADAVESGRAAAAAAGISAERVRFEEGKVEARLHDLLPADVIVLNPPRAGISSSVARTLSTGPAGEGARLAYVSCDPATLARDLQRLESAWALTSVQPFDAFPCTAHVETVAWLERRPA
ncbi:MAG: TRAM domain-containing protein [Gemmatimonadota bacterium]